MFVLLTQTLSGEFVGFFVQKTSCVLQLYSFPACMVGTIVDPMTLQVSQLDFHDVRSARSNAKRRISGRGHGCTRSGLLEMVYQLSQKQYFNFNNLSFGSGLVEIEQRSDSSNSSQVQQSAKECRYLLIQCTSLQTFIMIENL